MIAALLAVLLLVVCAIVRLYASLDEQWPRLDRKMAELVQPDPTHDRHRAWDGPPDPTRDRTGAARIDILDKHDRYHSSVYIGKPQPMLPDPSRPPLEQWEQTCRVLEEWKP